jgi:hypothetical protein
MNRASVSSRSAGCQSTAIPAEDNCNQAARLGRIGTTPW